MPLIGGKKALTSGLLKMLHYVYFRILCMFSIQQVEIKVSNSSEVRYWPGEGEGDLLREGWSHVGV